MIQFWYKVIQNRNKKINMTLIMQFSMNFQNKSLNIKKIDKCFFVGMYLSFQNAL